MGMLSAALTAVMMTTGTGAVARPPTVAQCRSTFDVDACYTAPALRGAYGVDRLPNKGRGRTIAILDHAGAPTAVQDLRTYDRAMGLPKPKIIAHAQDLGAAEAAGFDEANPWMRQAAVQTTLDLQAAHLMAPEATLVLQRVNLPAGHWRALLENPAGEVALIADAVREVVTETPADVVSIGYAIPETALAGAGVAVTAAHGVFATAQQRGVTLLAPTGDTGAAERLKSGRVVRTVAWPASDPLVTAVGGTRVLVDPAGRRRTPDVVWDDRKGAAGGGRSAFFARPAFQDGVAAVAGEARGVPDVSLSASPLAGMLVYRSTGWTVGAGTGGAVPLMAGVVALAVEAGGARLGPLGPRLYGGERGIVDITRGRNGPDGFAAAKGYDLASGLGTVDAAELVPRLAGR